MAHLHSKRTELSRIHIWVAKKYKQKLKRNLCGSVLEFETVKASSFLLTSHNLFFIEKTKRNIFFKCELNSFSFRRPNLSLESWKSYSKCGLRSRLFSVLFTILDPKIDHLDNLGASLINFYLWTSFTQVTPWWLTTITLRSRAGPLNRSDKESYWPKINLTDVSWESCD